MPKPAKKNRREALLRFCASLPHATQDIKWENDLVFSIGEKMFACFNATEGDGVSFKTSPAEFTLLVERPGIVPAPYLGRFHWVRVEKADAMPLPALQELIEESYRLVRAGLPKRTRQKLESA